MLVEVGLHAHAGNLLGGIAAGCFQGGVYSASELRSVELPAFVALAPPPDPPPLVEREFDQSVYDTNGNRVGPKRTFRAMQHEDPPEPPKSKRKPKAAA